MAPVFSIAKVEYAKLPTCIFLPLLLWIWKRDEVRNIRRHAIDITNFQLSMSLFLLPCLLFSVYPIAVLLAVYSQVLIIVNTVKVTNDQAYKYPLSINFLKL
jgi:hypothetical protein